MDEYTADAFANRDEPIPLLMVTDDASASETDRIGKREKLKQSALRMKEIARDLRAEQAQKLQTTASSSLQDRLFSKYVLSAVLSDK